MKKALLIVMSVAVLGSLGLYTNKKPGNATAVGVPSSSNTLVAADKTQAASGASTASGSSGSNSSSAAAKGQYKDGTYSGTTDTPYGTVSIAVVVSSGKINDVQFLQMPSDQGHSREVTANAGPILKQETIQAQSANIDFISGATSTSMGYEQSLQQALNQAVQA